MSRWQSSRRPLHLDPRPACVPVVAATFQPSTLGFSLLLIAPSLGGVERHPGIHERVADCGPTRLVDAFGIGTSGHDGSVPMARDGLGGAVRCPRMATERCPATKDGLQCVLVVGHTEQHRLPPDPGWAAPAAAPAPYRSAGDRDPTGLFFVPPVERGWFNDQGCFGPIGIGIIVSIGVIWYGLANSGDPVAVIAVVVLLVLIAVIVRALSKPGGSGGSAAR